MRANPTLIYQPLGNSWAVGIESDDPEAIISQDFSWYNHGAYKGQLTYMSERFAHIWTTEEDYKKYLYNSSMAYLLGKYENSLKEKVKRYARLLALLRLKSLKHETFISVSNNDRYALRVPNGHGATSKQSGAFDEEGWKQTCVSYYSFK